MKYKRIFTFGCSFTLHAWPTWADVINKSYKPDEFYNFGYPGAGNQYIYTQLVNANKKYKFTKDDLVMVLWSTYTREDRYRFNGVGHCGWILRGNMFNPGDVEIFSKKFIHDYVDYRGVAIRDLTYMYLAKTSMDNTDAEYKPMLSVPIDMFTESEGDHLVTDNLGPVQELYKPLLDSFIGPALIDTMPNKQWGLGVPCLVDGKLFNDAHPTVTQQVNFIEQHGFQITDEAKTYAKDSDEWMFSEPRDRKYIADYFKVTDRIYAVY